MGNVCCGTENEMSKANYIQEDAGGITRSIVNTEGPQVTMADGESSEEEKSYVSSNDGLTAIEKQEKIRDALNKLETILFHSTRKGLKPKLTKLKPEQKLELIRAFAKNFPERWLYKFEQTCFDSYR